MKGKKYASKKWRRRRGESMRKKNSMWNSVESVWLGRQHNKFSFSFYFIIIFFFLSFIPIVSDALVSGERRKKFKIECMRNKSWTSYRWFFFLLLPLSLSMLLSVPPVSGHYIFSNNTLVENLRILWRRVDDRPTDRYETFLLNVIVCVNCSSLCTHRW